jgi:hypothetical protein
MFNMWISLGTVIRSNSYVSVRIQTGYAVDIATGYGLEDPGSILGIARLFSSQRADQFWGPHSLISNGYRGLLPRG